MKQKIEGGKKHTKKQQKLIALGLSPDSWLLRATKKEIDYCICNEWDGKGVSACGFPCPVHAKELPALPTTTKPQKIEGGWVERFDNLENFTYIDDYGVDALYLGGVEVVKSFISTEIERAKASERQRCVEAVEGKRAVWTKPDTRENRMKTSWWNSAIDQAKHNLEQLK